MRDPNRLDKMYKIICFLHKKYLPDIRIGQLINNFLGWHFTNYHTDCFYIEEDEFIKRFTEYIEEVRPC